MTGRWIERCRGWYDCAAAMLERAAGEDAASGWFLGLAARFVFASALLVFFVNSALTKFDGLLPGAGAYAQIVPPVAEAANYDPGNIAAIPWGVIVLAGTYAEFLLPWLIVLGLFTRLSALAMIGFVAVMTFVDIRFHGVGAETIGALFDRTADSPIADQRLLWLFPLIYLVVRGPGAVSLDAWLARRFPRAPGRAGDGTPGGA